MTLVLGPLLRYVDETTAAIWVETDAPAEVSVTAGGRSWTARTFAVHGHHYALVECDGLEPGTVTPYAVSVGGEQVWPVAVEGLRLPPPVISTLKPGKPLRLAFGSCRTSVSHDAKGNRLHGVDAMRAYALAMAGITQEPDSLPWPDLLLFLGDQVYADETSEEMREFIAARRDIDEPPGTELADFQEYAHLYRVAWSDPANRWLLSTLPSAMIFDDHDIRDDWNTSAEWRAEMEATDWWHGRIVAGLASYWVYQHLGNLSPQARAEDEIWKLVRNHAADHELDLTETLDAFAERVDHEPASYRWSFARDVEGCRLVVVDSRAARVLTDGERSMLDPQEMAWLDDQMQGGFEHLLIGTSLPFLLPAGLQHLEAFSEALAGGAWGRVGARVGERLRQGLDLEHWGAFQDGFQRVARMALEVAEGSRGRAPRSITFLSGDVHHSYVSRVRRDRADRADRGEAGSASEILQMVCSPIRNPLTRPVRAAAGALSHSIASALTRPAARAAGVSPPPFAWSSVKGPWFDNNLATMDVVEDGLRVWWATGVVDDDHDRPRLERVAAVHVVCPEAGRPQPSSPSLAR